MVLNDNSKDGRHIFFLIKELVYDNIILIIRKKTNFSRSFQWGDFLSKTLNVNNSNLCETDDVDLPFLDFGGYLKTNLSFWHNMVWPYSYWKYFIMWIINYLRSHYSIKVFTDFVPAVKIPLLYVLRGFTKWFRDMERVSPSL